MFVDYVQNGTGHGPVGSVLEEIRFDPGLLRPYLDERGRKVVTANSKEWVEDKVTGHRKPKKKQFLVRDLQEAGFDHPVYNATTLRKGQWIQMQERVQMVARRRLRAWTDLAASSTIGGFDGMAKMTYEYEMSNDPHEAVVDMDMLADARHDEHLFKLASIPLPITHSGFWYSRRRLAAARAGGTPLDLRSAEAAGRRVAEMIEKTVIGVETGMNYGTQTAGYGTHEGQSQVYGYTNFPYRTTKTDLTAPTGLNPEAVLADVLEMIEILEDDNYTGPYILYHSRAYSRYLNDDYFRSGSTSAVRSLRQRIMENDVIQDIRRLDYLDTGFQLLLVQMSSETASAINAMDISTVQWESRGGFQLNFRVFAIQVPLLFRDYNGQTAIVHATTS